MRAQAQLAIEQRDARNRLEQAYTQLLRLLEQNERIHKNLLQPAREMYAIARRGFAAGELNVLTLVDASNTYFDAHARHLQLQQESALAAADLRLAAGISVIDSQKEVRSRHGGAEPSGAGVTALHLLPQSAGYASNVSEVQP